MHLTSLLRAAVFTTTLALFAGCTSSPMNRIDANRALYDSWPVEMQQAVLDGRVEKGMTPDMVRVSIGKPTEVTSRSTRKGEEEIWVYRTGGGGNSILSGTSISAGTGGIGVNSSSGGGGGSYAEERQVVFVDGVVVRADEAAK